MVSCYTFVFGTGEGRTFFDWALGEEGSTWGYWGKELRGDSMGRKEVLTRPSRKRTFNDDIH